MNETLLYLLRHNVWATNELLDVCRGLSPEQLNAPGSATYGSIIETFDHLVDADGGYLSCLGGPQTPWGAARPEGFWKSERLRVDDADLDELARRAEETGRLWASFFESEEFDPDRVCLLDDGTYECPAWIVIAEVFHHGSIHREQICAMLTGLGIEPPDVQPWGLADKTGLSRFLHGRTS